MILDDKLLTKILLAGAYVSKEDIEKAKLYAEKYDRPIRDFFIQEELLTNDLIGQAVAEAFKMSYADLNTNIPPKAQVLRIPEEFARKYRLIFYSETTDHIVVATDAPIRKVIEPVLVKLFPNIKVTLAYSLTEDIESSLKMYQKALDKRFEKLLKKQFQVAPDLLAEMFRDAFSNKASDIHIEPQGDFVVIRFRIDGVLQNVGEIPMKFYPAILNRIKLKSALRTDEHFAAQDGSMQIEIDGRILDMRTSIVPTVEGEKVVLRLFSAYVKEFSLGELGLTPENQEIINNVAHKPFGMILVTGPTGSGKTTTLYAILRILKDPAINIITIEDPVEYRVKGINQIQVNTSTDLTFAKGLRSVVRQDPDVILVGEIRDVETAQISVNAALTGHLLLSTLHANNAATAIPRLLEMDVEPFLLSSTVEVIISQRLIRRICESCRTSIKLSRAQLDKIYGKLAKEYFKKPSVTLYKGKGCNVCGHTGYHGRSAIYEIIEMTPPLRELILENPSAQHIWDEAKKQGAKSLFDDGMQKVKDGITTIDEVMRVASTDFRRNKT
jgi:type II secretory ATPase GspE/PulE/Tfp pilus assembly ATPase PilB-like protein